MRVFHYNVRRPCIILENIISCALLINGKDFQLHFINYINFTIFVLFTYQFINIIF